MLDSSDKEFIRKEIQEAIGSKEEAKDKKKDPRKLTMSDVVKGTGRSINAVRTSRLGKGAVDALLYSNPLTTALAYNSDLLKMLGKGSAKVLGASYNLIKNKLKPKEKTNKKNDLMLNSSKMLPTNTQKFIGMQTTNYIMAKNAMFVGGKNYININMPAGKMGSFSLPTAGAKDVMESKNRLDLPSGPVIDAQILKNNKAQLIEAKTTNKLLGLINKRMMLILGGILLGVAGIGGVAALIHNIFKHKKNDINPKNTMTKLTQYQNTNSTDKIDNINNAISKESKLKDVKVIDKGSDNGKNWLPRSGVTAKSKAGAPYRAPFDLKVLSYQVNSRNVGGLDLKVERTATKTRKNSVIMNVVNPTVVPGDMVKKGQIIGEVGETGQIFIKDISDKEFSDYQKMIDDYAGRSEEDKLTEIQQIQEFMNAGQSDKVNRAMGAIRFKQLQKDSNKPGTGFSDFVSIDEKDINNYSGEMGHSVESLKDRPMEIRAKDPTILDKIKGTINSRNNKNAEIAKAQAVKAKPETNIKSETVENKPQNNNNKVAITPGKDKIRSHGLSYPMDIAVANCNTFTV